MRKEVIAARCARERRPYLSAIKPKREWEIMKTLIAIIAATVALGSADNAQTVSGYTRWNGTYVTPYTRSAPNGTPVDNYGRRN